MRLVTYQSDTGPRVAAMVNGGLVNLNRADSRLPYCIKDLLAEGMMGLMRLWPALAGRPVLPMEDIKLLPVVPSPEKLLCVGLNYADHAKESGVAPPAEPVFFSKFATAPARMGIRS